MLSYVGSSDYLREWSAANARFCWHHHFEGWSFTGKNVRHATQTKWVRVLAMLVRIPTVMLKSKNNFRLSFH